VPPVAFIAILRLALGSVDSAAPRDAERADLQAAALGDGNRQRSGWESSPLVDDLVGDL
jgi:hypothetical protein